MRRWIAPMLVAVAAFAAMPAAQAAHSPDTFLLMARGGEHRHGGQR